MLMIFCAGAKFDAGAEVNHEINFHWPYEYAYFDRRNEGSKHCYTMLFLTIANPINE